MSSRSADQAASVAVIVNLIQPTASQAAFSAPVEGFPVLNGWRGISIVAILLAHLPLLFLLPFGTFGPRAASVCAYFGMAIFFALSGFLITTTLYEHPSVRVFIIRRLFRIVPPAWLYIFLVFSWIHASPRMWQANLFFYANRWPFYLGSWNGHLWSLCIEVQFYAFIAFLFLFLRRRGLALLPLFCVAVTINRIYLHIPNNIETIYRVDEILSGASLAVLIRNQIFLWLKRLLTVLPPVIPLLLLLLSCDLDRPRMNYLRPYFAAVLLGTTLLQDLSPVHPHPFGWRRLLRSRSLAYLAGISYSLYLFHVLTVRGWFVDGHARYFKLVLSVAVCIGMAHLSSFFYEIHWIRLGKRLAAKSALG